MNIRKSTDYSSLFAKLDSLITLDLTQIELYLEIGTAICDRPEKGAAVAAAEYLQHSYPDMTGFSSRNVRRMRDLCRRYGSNPSLLQSAQRIGWTQNIVILESCESEAECLWYIQAVQQYGWSKQELTAKIADKAHSKAQKKAASKAAAA